MEKRETEKGSVRTTPVLETETFEEKDTNSTFILICSNYRECVTIVNVLLS